MESVFLKIRITTDDEGNVKELCNRAVAWAYILDGSLDGEIYMVKSKHTFLYYNIAPETLEKAKLYDETKLVKLEGLAEFKALLP